MVEKNIHNGIIKKKLEKLCELSELTNKKSVTVAHSLHFQ